MLDLIRSNQISFLNTDHKVLLAPVNHSVHWLACLLKKSFDKSSAACSLGINYWMWQSIVSSLVQTKHFCSPEPVGVNLGFLAGDFSLLITCNKLRFFSELQWMDMIILHLSEACEAGEKTSHSLKVYSILPPLTAIRVLFKTGTTLC